MEEFIFDSLKGCELNFEDKGSIPEDVDEVNLGVSISDLVLEFEPLIDEDL